MNLRWSGCFGDGGTVNRVFACATCGGSNVLVASFQLDDPSPPISSIDIAIGIATASSTLPPWWEFYNANACRRAALSVNTVIPGTAISCADWSDVEVAGAIQSYLIGANGPNTALLQCAFTRTGGDPSALAGAQEYFVANVVINISKTVGTGACAGCSTGACILLSRIRLRGPSGDPVIQLTSPTEPGSNLVTAYGGAGAQCSLTPTHTRSPSWGSIKQLYYGRGASSP